MDAADSHITVQASGDEATVCAGEPHLLVFGSERAPLFRLAMDGSYVIGRAAEADIVVTDHSVSRKHAVLALAAGRARLRDLGSVNGTRVNGQRVTEPLDLRVGDVISVGSVQIVFQRMGRERGRPDLLTWQAFEQCLRAEVERSLPALRPLSLLLAHVSEPWTKDLWGPFVSSLRTMDALALHDDHTLAILLPEISVMEARLPAHRLLQLLQEKGMPARVGAAGFPEDASDASALLEAAGVALDRTPVGQVCTPEDTVHVSLGKHLASFAEPSVKTLLALTRKLAVSDLPVLVYGETGVGKELFAAAVHHFSPRARGPMVTMNCAALPENLVESELFGYNRGAFTGAVEAHAGKLEAAAGGTLFLDEIGEMPLALQAKLLRVLEEKELTRLGDNKPRKLDLRLVAATNRDLRQEADYGRFRSDLYYRLSAAIVVVPPLRERPRDVPLLARHFAEQIAARSGAQPLEVPPSTLRLLNGYAWPGNVRELRNVMERAAATATGPSLEPWMLPAEIRGDDPSDESAVPARSLSEELREFERRRIVEALEEAGWIQARAAAAMGLPVRTLYDRMRQYGIEGRRRRRQERS